MECLKDDRMLKFRPDTLEVVRKELDLEKPGRIDEAVDILENWVQMQPHFVKKDFSRDYLERTLIGSKGLVERAKERLDKLCTFKTLMPEYFNDIDVKRDFRPLQEYALFTPFPQLTPEHHRVFVYKVVSENFGTSEVFNFYKYLVTFGEYIMQADYCAGFHIIFDYSITINFFTYLSKVNPMELRQIVTVVTKGYGCRIKGIHVISSSKMVDSVIIMLKQVFSAKLADRIHIHKTPDTLSEYIPKKIMTSDYGGEEKSLLELNKAWLEIIDSKQFLDYINVMNKAKTNESCRKSDKFNELYIGMPGSFRTLNVD